MEDLDFDVTVVRNDEFSMDFVENFDKILISPGPGIPDEAFVKIQRNRNNVAHDPKNPVFNFSSGHKPHAHKKNSGGDGVDIGRPISPHFKAVVELINSKDRPHE